MYYIGFADKADRGRRKGKIDIAVFASVKSMNKNDKQILEDYFSSGMSEDELLEKYPESKGYGDRPLLNSLNMGKIYYGIDFVSDSDPIIYWDFELNDNFPVYVSNVFQDKNEAYSEFYNNLKNYYNSDNLYRIFVEAVFKEGITGINSI